MHREPHLFSSSHSLWVLQPLMIAWVFPLASMGGLALAQPSPVRVERLTGCLDERPGPQYVLRDDEHDLRLVALLEPVGFPVQAFAEYLRLRVVVTGIRASRNVHP